MVQLQGGALTSPFLLPLAAATTSIPSDIGNTTMYLTDAISTSRWPAEEPTDCSAGKDGGAGAAPTRPLVTARLPNPAPAASAGPPAVVRLTPPYAADAYADAVSAVPGPVGQDEAGHYLEHNGDGVGSKAASPAANDLHAVLPLNASAAPHA